VSGGERKRGGCLPKMAGCGVTCGHWQIVNGYWFNRQAQEARVEAATTFDAADTAREEVRNYYADVEPSLTFPAYLSAMARAS
jgi:hypothetical protein